MKSRVVTITVDLFVWAETEAEAASIVKEALAQFKVRFQGDKITGTMLRSLDVKTQ